MENDKKIQKDRGRKLPKPVTADRLEKGALAYLERFATSAENLRRVLMRRVERSARLHGTDREEGARVVEALLERFLRAGLLDDRAYADMKVNGLNRRGVSTRMIRMKLAAKGVDGDTLDAALEDLREEVGEPDGVAAVNYARRRRIGPFRLEDAREKYRDRDLAALGRQGFDLDLARKIVDAPDVDALEEIQASF